MAIAVSPKQSACGPPYPLRDTDLSRLHSSCVSLWERGRPARGLTKMRISYGEYGQWTSY